MQNGSENGVKMEPRSQKESPELILDAMKASATKMLQKSQEEVSETAREPGLGAPNKGKT